jgi:hypothetical protein
MRSDSSPGRAGLRARLAVVAAVLAAALAAASCAGRELVRQYEYEEEIYLSLDGSATIYVNASLPALASLRGLPVPTNPDARVDRPAVRALYSSPVTKVTRVSAWRRFGRRFVQVRVDVDDVTRLGSAAPFSWSTYSIARRDNLVIYRQVMGHPAGGPVGNVGWNGSELTAVRLHLPSRIRYHNAGADNLRRGNILVWEQSLSERQAGKPLDIEARVEQTSILYSTLILFAVSGALALSLLALIVAWVVRRGRAAAKAEAGSPPKA